MHTRDGPASAPFVETAERPGAALPRAPGGVVVVYSPDGSGFAQRHEWATRTGIAERLAALKGFVFSGDYDPSAHGPGPVYFVPSDTLVGVEAARALGVRGRTTCSAASCPTPSSRPRR